MKPNSLFPLALVTALAFTTYSANAQCEQCNTELIKAAKQYVNVQQGASFNQVTQTLYQHDFEYWMSYGKSGSNSLNLDAAYNAFNMRFGSSSNRSSQKQEFEKERTTYQQNSTIATEQSLAISRVTADNYTLSIYKACIDGCSSTGLSISVERQPGSTSVIVTLSWKPTPMPQESKVTSIITPGLKLVQDRQNQNTLRKGAIIKSGNALIAHYELDGNIKMASVRVAVENGESYSDRVEAVDGPPSTTHILPLGAVIMSPLNYAQFCVANSQPGILDLKTSTWAPADGRAISESALGRTGITYAPDLRGVFVRGVNEFYQNGQPPLADNRKDPDSNRNPMVVQLDMVGSHTHTYKDRFHNVRSTIREEEHNRNSASVRFPIR